MHLIIKFTIIIGGLLLVGCAQPNKIQSISRSSSNYSSYQSTSVKKNEVQDPDVAKEYDGTEGSALESCAKQAADSLDDGKSDAVSISKAIPSKCGKEINDFTKGVRNALKAKDVDLMTRIQAETNLVNGFNDGQAFVRVVLERRSARSCNSHRSKNIVCNAENISKDTSISHTQANISSASIPSQVTIHQSAENSIKLNQIGGVYEVPVLINEVLKINVILDSGAADISIAPDVALTLIRTGTVEKRDWLSGKIYTFADGTQAKSARFTLKSIALGNKTFTNVECSISANVNAPMLLGQSVLRLLGRYTIDYQKGVLQFE